jgi:hypothetical protein
VNDCPRQFQTCWSGSDSAIDGMNEGRVLWKAAAPVGHAPGQIPESIFQVFRFEFDPHGKGYGYSDSAKR